jgi:hypothetical protein
MQTAADAPLPGTKRVAIIWIDLVIMCLLAATGSGLIWNCSHRISTGLRNIATQNVWFESDVSRAFYNMAARKSNQHRTSVHPLFPLVANPICTAFAKVGHLSLNDAADGFLATMAGLWMVLMYLVIRSLGFDRILAAFAALMGLVSSSALLFFSVPETYSLSSVSILATLVLVIFTAGTRWEAIGELLASACSLSITVTNWSLGWFLTFRRQQWKKWIQLTVNAFVVVVAFWTVEKAAMVTSEFFTGVRGERNSMTHQSLLHLVQTANVFLFNGMVAPAVRTTADFGDPGHRMGPVWNTGLTLQLSWPGSASAWGIAAAIVWCAILIVGFITLLRGRRTRVTQAILIYLAAQLLLHLLYGFETFMYALDWMPILVIVAIYGFNRLRRARWPAAILFTGILAMNNLMVFQTISEKVQSFYQANPIAPPTTVEEMNFPPVDPGY